MDKISKLIAKEFDTRCEVMVATYIVSEGFEELKEVTEENISAMKGNGLMTQEFVQSLVRVAVKICKEFSVMEFMTWLRKECWFTPFPHEYELCKGDVSEVLWDELTANFEEPEDDVLRVRIMTNEEM